MNVLRSLPWRLDVVHCCGTLVRGLSSSAQLYKKKAKAPEKKPDWLVLPTGPSKAAPLITSEDASYMDLPIILIRATYNNTLIYLQNHRYETIRWTSGGKVGFKNAAKGTPYAARKAGESIANICKENGVRSVRVKFKGMGPGRLDAITGISSEGINVVSMTDATYIPKNGPRPKKAKRL